MAAMVETANNSKLKPAAPLGAGATHSVPVRRSASRVLGASAVLDGKLRRSRRSCWLSPDNAASIALCAA